MCIWCNGVMYWMEVCLQYVNVFMCLLRMLQYRIINMVACGDVLVYDVVMALSLRGSLLHSRRVKIDFLVSVRIRGLGVSRRWDLGIFGRLSTWRPPWGAKKHRKHRNLRFFEVHWKSPSRAIYYHVECRWGKVWRQQSCLMGRGSGHWRLHPLSGSIHTRIKPS